MANNLRSDDTFVEDEAWHLAAGRYRDFLRGHEGARLLFLELGVGWNTPGIIKYPFQRMAAGNERGVYAWMAPGFPTWTGAPCTAGNRPVQSTALGTRVVGIGRMETTIGPFRRPAG